MEYKLTPFADGGRCEISDGVVRFTADRDGEVFFGFDLVFPDRDDVYIMLPSCVYGGNRMKRVERFYPPRYRLSETGVDCEPITTDVPGMGADGRGRFEVTAGDLATPCAALFQGEENAGEVSQRENRGRSAPEVQGMRLSTQLLFATANLCTQLVRIAFKQTGIRDFRIEITVGAKTLAKRNVDVNHIISACILRDPEGSAGCRLPGCRHP